MSTNVDKEIIISSDDVFKMLDRILEKRDGEWWDNFYSNRTRPVPFFKDIPDEDLISFCNSNLFHIGKALDIGCGNGRNTRYLSKQGFDATGIDISSESIEWANTIVCGNKNVPCFKTKSLFEFEAEDQSFDLILDSGCFHHIKPHRREIYLKKIERLLKDDGYYLMTCFNLDGGANITDYDVYRDYSMHGGLGFSEYKIKTILDFYFNICEFRKMKETDNVDVFGKDFMWVILMKKRSA